MAKHTPGPWHAREWTCHAKTSIGIKGGTLSFIQLAECSGLGNHPYVSPEQEEANVRLITAAPELLEALWSIYGLLESVDKPGPVRQRALDLMARLGVQP